MTITNPALLSKSTVERAKQLPDELFNEHPEVVSAREAIRSALAGIQAAQQGIPRVDVRGLRDRIEQMETVQRSERAVLAEKALADLLAGDLGFTRAAAMMEEAERMQRELNCARLALELYQQRAADFGEPTRQAQQWHTAAKADERRILDRMKLERAAREANEWKAK